MKLKKLLAGMTALLCCAGTLAFFPEREFDRKN